MKRNANSKKMSFGTPEQRGDVTVYPAAPPERSNATSECKKRTAAYVRVSTDTVQQEGSLILQREWYEEYIKSRPEYEFVEIYEDDGISATSVERRFGFLRMIEDCKAGKIDLIITKSISRFGRNTADTLSYINLLNALPSPVEVYFETERLSSWAPVGEPIITVLAMSAQEDSRSKSASITWAVDNLFAQGKYYVVPILGYDKAKGRTNPLVINEQEAETVRFCYRMAVNGHSLGKIAGAMNELGLKNKSGRIHWTAGRVRALLSNEKYAGAVLARKTVTPNYKTHKSKKNEGEKPQYYHPTHHTPIVPPSVHKEAERIINHRRGDRDGIPYLSAIPDGALRGFVAVSKHVRGYTLDDYTAASQSVNAEVEASEIDIPAHKISRFDLRSCQTLSTLLLEDRSKPCCSIKDGTITLNASCVKTLGTNRAELLFHPTKAILALRAFANGNAHSQYSSILNVDRPVHLSEFVPVALESAGLENGCRYRVYGTRRVRNGECVMLFGLRNAGGMSKNRGEYILPEKYAHSYGNGFYENFASCGLYKIDFDGLWQVSQASRPDIPPVGQTEELNEFRRSGSTEY